MEKSEKILIKKLYRYYRLTKITLLLLTIRKIKHIWLYDRYKYMFYFLLFIFISILGYHAVINKTIIVDNSTHKIEYRYIDTVNDIDNYLRQIKYVESRNNYLSRRKYKVIRNNDTLLFYSQYIGYYQMGKSARKSIGFDKYSDCEYWNSPVLQDLSFLLWIKRLRKSLKPYIDKYDGKWVGNYYCTESGIIAMAHLCGVKATKSFLDSNGSEKDIPKDGNGKRGTDYLMQFGRYKINFDDI